MIQNNSTFCHLVKKSIYKWQVWGKTYCYNRSSRLNKYCHIWRLQVEHILSVIPTTSTAAKKLETAAKKLDEIWREQKKWKILFKYKMLTQVWLHTPKRSYPRSANALIDTKKILNCCNSYHSLKVLLILRVIFLLCLCFV